MATKLMKVPEIIKDIIKTNYKTSYIVRTTNTIIAIDIEDSIAAKFVASYSVSDNISLNFLVHPRLLHPSFLQHKTDPYYNITQLSYFT